MQVLLGVYFALSGLTTLSYRDPATAPPLGLAATLVALFNVVYPVALLVSFMVTGKGQMGSALMGSLQISYLLAEGLLGYSR